MRKLVHDLIRNLINGEVFAKDNLELCMPVTMREIEEALQSMDVNKTLR